MSCSIYSLLVVVITLYYGREPQRADLQLRCPLEAKNELTLVSLLYPINEKYRRLSSRPGRVVLSIDSGST